MVTEKMKQILVGIIAVILIIAIALLASNTHWGKSVIGIGENESGIINTTLNISEINLNIQTSLERIQIHANAPEPRSSLPYYRAYYAPGDVQEKKFGDTDKERFNLTTVEKAPDLARRAMEPYGGIPSDAYVSLSVINKAIIGDLKNPTEIKYFNNQIYFSRTINGIPITGMDDGIIVWLGDNGELLRYHKFWRTLEKVGDVPVVSVDKSIQKLEKREMVNPPQSPSDATVTSINLRYYAKSWNAKEIYLEPVYEFYSTLSNGHDYQFFVYARQFAGFTQTPTVITKSVAGKTVQEKDPLTVTFTDISETSPTKWLWDFGDGTTSSDQNPVHTYKTPGTYNVSLTVWNDMGPDTIVQQCVVAGETAKTTVTTIPGTTSTVPTINQTTIPATTIITTTQTVSTPTPTPTTTTSSLPATSVPAITTNETATTSPIPITAVTISPTVSPGITGNTMSGNTTVG